MRWLLALTLAFACTGAWAQGLESALRPGPVIAGHAQWEDDCAACHVRFDRAAQDRLCADCHKDVGRDMRERTGFHGRQPAQACRACHTDHKGRTAKVVVLDETRFDHRQTDYLLKGRHDGLRCASCHLPGRRWREAPQACNACHRDDDAHRGSLGAACADCHAETGWRQTRFDHASTRFALEGRHAAAECKACHRSAVYEDVGTTCHACHRDDDQGPRGHQGRFGEKCESCHDARAWKPAVFRHDRDTRFALRGAHRATACTACHTGPLYRDKTPTACVDCHRRDDVHEGRLGAACASCHAEQRWRETPRFDHDRTRFALRGGHRDAKCSACHRPGAAYTVADTRCVACHRGDDRHQPTLGERCESCHAETRWRDVARFDHAKARFALRGAHLKAECSACHRDARHRETPTACIACHRDDDRHAGQLGEQCASCHGEAAWTSGVRFDHAGARFALTGRHVGAACSACHQSPRYRDAPRECVACHRREDRHEARLGTRCESCHSTRDWRLWTFDHGRRTRFALDGAHQGLACVRCHTAPAPAGRAVAPVGDTCVACHRDDDRHDGAFGGRCEQCHVTSDWTRLRQRLAPGAGRAPS